MENISIDFDRFYRVLEVERVKPSGNFRIIVSVFGSYNDELLQVCTQISWSLITESVDDRNLVDILQVSF